MQKLLDIVVSSAYLVICCFGVWGLGWVATFVKREKKTRALEDDYAAWQSHREDLLHHYHRAREEDDKATVEALKPKVIRATKGLQAVQAEYEQMSASKNRTR